jgi:predicted DNA-binding transcriptional regulator AlpA
MRARSSQSSSRPIPRRGLSRTEAAEKAGHEVRHVEVDAYLSRATLAATLDIAESTVDDFVKRGILPKPVKLSTGCVRWSWRDVEKAITARKGEAGASPSDPYMEGVTRVTQTLEGRRRVS